MADNLVKHIISFTAVILLSGSICFSQKKLDSNPVFFELVSRTLRYPAGAVNHSLYGRIYVKFEVDDIGMIEDIQIVHPAMSKKFDKRIGFERNIKECLGKLPLLGLGYQGRYLLPIAYIYTNYGKKPTVSLPTNTLPSFIDVDNLSLLHEVEVKGFSSTNYHYNLLPDASPPSKQIVE